MPMHYKVNANATEKQIFILSMFSILQNLNKCSNYVY